MVKGTSLNLENRLVDTPDKYVTEVFEPSSQGFGSTGRKGFMMSHGITPL